MGWMHFLVRRPALLINAIDTFLCKTTNQNKTMPVLVNLCKNLTESLLSQQKLLFHFLSELFKHLGFPSNTVKDMPCLACWYLLSTAKVPHDSQAWVDSLRPQPLATTSAMEVQNMCHPSPSEPILSFSRGGSWRSPGLGASARCSQRTFIVPPGSYLTAQLTT